MNPIARLLPALALALALVAARGAAQALAVTEHYTVTGPGSMSWCAAGAGDVNADGHDDFLVAFEDTPDAVRVFSGADGSILLNLPRPGGTGIHGWDAEGIGDIDADGHDDVIVGTDADDYFLVFSGGTGLVLQSGSGAFLGRVVAAAGDVDSDGTPDYMATTSIVDVTVFSGATGSPIHVTTLPALAADADGVGDLDGDGHDDYAIGSSFAGNNAGTARVYSGFSGQLVFDLVNPGTDLRWGHHVAGAGDVNADQVPDILVAAENGTAAVVFSGADGSVLAQLPFGRVTDLDGAGDVNGDGFDDVIVGSSSFSYFRVCSGADFMPLFDVLGSGNLGFRVARAGDIDGNGTSDVIASMPTGPGARVFGMTATDYPGSGEDLILFTGAGPVPTPFNVKEVEAGDVLTITLRSPGGTFLPYPPVIGAQVLSGSPPSVPGFPEVHIDPNATVAVLFDGLRGPFGPVTLPETGLTIGGIAIPAGLSGSLMIQAFSLASIATNGIFAATDGNEIVFLP